MAAGEESRKLLCECGKPLGIFTVRGLQLYCRFSKETTTAPYGIADQCASFMPRCRQGPTTPL
jgi:hypothetical protein